MTQVRKYDLEGRHLGNEQREQKSETGTSLVSVHSVISDQENNELSCSAAARAGHCNATFSTFSSLTVSISACSLLCGHSQLYAWPWAPRQLALQSVNFKFPRLVSWQTKRINHGLRMKGQRPRLEVEDLTLKVAHP